MTVSSYLGSNTSSPSKLHDLPPPPEDLTTKPPPDTARKLGGVTVSVKSTKLPPPRVPSKTEKARAIGRATTHGGMATSGDDDEGFISVSSLRRQFEKGPNKLTGTTITPVATLQQMHGNACVGMETWCPWFSFYFRKYTALTLLHQG